MQHVESDPVAERGRGEVNLSPTKGLTLRPRVGGFYVSGRLWEVQSVVFYVCWKALGGSICCILYAARRPADPVKSCPCFILRRFLPRASYFDICSFCAPEGRIAPIGASRLRRSLTARLRRDGLIPKKTYRWPCFTLPLHLPGALLFARPKGALRLSARLIGGGC